VSFKKEVQDALGHYVYGLIDPFNEEVFYIGKANRNNRAFDHLKSKAKAESEKALKIDEIRAKGKEPRVDVLRFGLETESVALEVEASLIDAFGLEKLTNSVRGHNIERGRFTGDQAIRACGKTSVY